MILKRSFWLVIKFVIALWIIVFLSKSNFLSFSTTILSIISPSNFVILPMLMAAIVINSYRWFLLLRSQKINIPFLKCLEIYYTGYSFNFVFPGGIAGDIVKITQIIKCSDNKSVAAMSVIFDKGFGLISCCLVILFFLPQILLKINESGWGFIYSEWFILIYYSAVLILCLCLSILLYFLIQNKVLYKRATSFFAKKKNKISLFLYKIIKGIFSYRKSKKILFINMFIAVFVQILVAFCLLLLGNNILKINIDLIYYLLSSISAQISGIIPISPGGLGVEEGAFANMLYLLNDRRLLQYATIYFVFRIFSLIISIPAIIIFFTRKINQNPSLESLRSRYLSQDSAGSALRFRSGSVWKIHSKCGSRLEPTES